MRNNSKYGWATKASFIAVSIVSLCGCASLAKPEPVIKTMRVEVPVAVQCVPKTTPEPPTYVDTDAALKSAAGPEDRFQLMAAGRIQRMQRQAITEPIISACRTK